MSPEQARGDKSDHRADIFAFGAILYEMLAGRRAFQGASAVETLNAILTQEPPELPPPVPPALERISRHCLEKNPEARFQSARDLAFHLEGMSGSSSPGFLSATSARRRIWDRPRVAWSVAALGALAAAVVTAVLAPTAVRSPETTVVRFTIPPPEHTTFYGPPVASPDGRSIAFVTIEGSSKSTLWLRRLDSIAAQALPNTDGALFPFWSPDSLSIGFFAQGKLERIDVSTGALRTICDAPNGRGGAWSRDGVVVFAPFQGPLHRVPAAGGTPKPVTPTPAPGVSHRWPQFLTDGVHFLYYAMSGHAQDSGVYVGSLDSTESKRLLEARSNALYAPSGHLLFARERTLQAQRFDPERLELTGEPFPVEDRVGTLVGPNAALFSISDSGLLVYQSTAWQSVELRWFDRSGGTLAVLGAPGQYGEFEISPDGKNVAVQREDPRTSGSDIWVLDASSGTPLRVTSDPSLNFGPVWSPDGDRLVFVSDRSGSQNGVYEKSLGGTEEEKLLFKSEEGFIFASDWSSDGRFIVYRDGASIDLWVYPLFGDSKPIPFLQTEFAEDEAHFSPNVRWMAYISNESGTYDVYVRPFPASTGKWRISTNGGLHPQWRRDGRELFYLAPEGKLMAVAVTTDGPFQAGVAKVLFDTRADVSESWYSVAADGQRFLVPVPVPETSPPLTVVLNWTAALNR